MRILNIFENLARNESGMTLTELSQVLDSPKSSLLSLLRTLVAMHYLQLLNNRYQLGPAILQLSMNILSGRSYASLTRTFLQELSERSGESVYLTSIDYEKMIVTYDDMIESRQAVRYAVGIGAVRPLYVSAAGKVLLAHQNQFFLDKFLGRGPFTNPVSGERIESVNLREELLLIRQEECAVSLNHAVEGAAGVAAPIFQPDGTATHALLIAAPLDRMLKNLTNMKKLVTDVARRASRTLAKPNLHN
jgi:DNA-binding IclR family transcriptional regulator